MIVRVLFTFLFIFNFFSLHNLFFISKLLNCYCSSDLPSPIIEHKHGTCLYCIVSIIKYRFVLTFLILILLLHYCTSDSINILKTVLYY